jgi:hypothetical protein
MATKKTGTRISASSLSHSKSSVFGLIDGFGTQAVAQNKRLLSAHFFDGDDFEAAIAMMTYLTVANVRKITPQRSNVSSTSAQTSVTPEQGNGRR